MNQAGLVAIAVAGLWIVYLVPHRLRYRQQLLESRSEDRFSEQLRVLRVTRAGQTRRGHRAASRSQAPVAAGAAGRGPARVLLHPAAPRRGGAGVMDRPHRTADRISADAARRAASEQAARAAHLARRAAAARRRLLLSVLLLTVTLAGWTGVALLGAVPVLGVAPSALLLATLGLGRRAVVAGARADAAWAARPRTPDHAPPLGVPGHRVEGRAARRARVRVATIRRTPGAVGRAVHPSEASTEVMARVPAAPERVPAAARPDVRREVDLDLREGSLTRADPRPTDAPQVPALQAGAREADASTSAEPGLWAPVPVPRPSYTLKGAAPHREPAPLVLDAPVTAEAAARGAVAGSGQDTVTGVPSAPEGEGAAAAAGTTAGSRAVATATPTEAPTPVAPGLDLDTILARRRASGE